MRAVRLSSKGQIAIPKSIRDGHAWKAGAKFTVEDTKDGLLLRPLPLFPAVTPGQARGALGPPPKKRKRLTEADMKAAIALGVKRRHARGRY